MSTMKTARRAARHDPRYKGQKHTANVWQRRMAAKLFKEAGMRMRKKK